MTAPPELRFAPVALEEIAGRGGRVAVLAEAGVRPDAAVRRIDRLARGAVARALASPAFAELKTGEALELAFPAGLAAEALLLVRLGRKAGAAAARSAGGAIARARGKGELLIVAGAHPLAADVATGFALAAYDFSAHRTAPRPEPGTVTVMAARPEALADAAAPGTAAAAAVHFARDLVNEPANVLTTTEFAARLSAMRELGLEVEVLEEDALVRLGMRTLLAVGQGSASPSRVVVMQWKGAGGPPLALVGKGVVFDTGGISMKPAAGMEEMTMDMGGAAVVAGAMRALALRRARAHVVGLVGLVENMPSGSAQRPGDVVRSMKGDTVEVINTDAEGRLVLADVLWYAQDRFTPSAVIDLATLTGAIMIALGHENAGLFANDDALAGAILAAARAEGEGAWRMPLGEGYDKLLKSRIADMKNVGTREGGAISAACFLQRFIRPGTPWAHLDIAGVTLAKEAGALWPKGATGWGVRMLNRLVRDRYEER
ncbi:MAG: leucyl aminopeptidase [Rhodobacteraceae bacterium]|jgi:leucyl aminopeptidase|nr:leucyl aminopeptidase [Paracoccaceae bacterium]